MNILAPAKLNLHLQVVDKRPDGYHNLKTAFQLIDLYDELEFKLQDEEIEIEETNVEIENNLVLLAADALKKASNINKGVKIKLTKNIPLQKGLGGGSSDAAATLLALNSLWSANLSINELMSIGLDLGSDIPFFLYGKNAWAEGRGEKMDSLILPKSWFLLIFPEKNISTKEAFEEIQPDDRNHINKKDFLQGKAFNTFEDWARQKYSEINDLFNLLKTIGKPRLSGTGSTIFISFSNKEDALSAKEKFSSSVLVNSLDDSPLRQLIE